MIRVYAAEREVFGGRIGTREHGMALTDATKLIHKYRPGLKVERSRSRTFGSVYYWEQEKCCEHITLGPLAGLPVVLHELAHALTPDDRGHGSAFMREYLRLVEIEMGPYWMRRLRAAFLRHQPRGWKAACR